MQRLIHPNPFIIQPPANLLEKHPALRRLSHTLSIEFAGGVQNIEGQTVNITEEGLQVMGCSLWDALHIQQEFDRAHKDAGAAILPIIIESDQANIQALPWETLYHPGLGFLGKDPGFTLSRRVEAPHGTRSTLDKGPLRVLLFTSLPDDVHPEKGRLNVEDEQIQVQEALLPWISKGVVELEMPDDGRFSTLKALLREFYPHILFLSGHGKFHHEPASDEPPYGEFSFESEAGDSNPIREDEIAQALIGIGGVATV